MSKLHKYLTSTAAALAIAAGSLVGVGGAPAPQAEAAHACMPATPSVYCSMFWANRAYTDAKFGASNTSTANLQKALTQIGLPVGVTGKFTTATKTALIKYQKSRRLPQTGLWDARTMRAMRAGAGIYLMIPELQKPSKGAIVVKYAYAQVGKYYQSGGTGPSRYDCSGLTMMAWRSAGVSIPRTSYSQLSGLKTVSRSSLRPGDIVGYYSGGHVSIYVGNGYIIHSSRPGQPIKKVPLAYMPYYKAVRPAG